MSSPLHVGFGIYLGQGCPKPQLSVTHWQLRCRFKSTAFQLSADSRYLASRARKCGIVDEGRCS